MRTAREVSEQVKADEREESQDTKLVRLRQRYRLTIQEVATEVGCTKSHLWGVEQGKSEPGVQLALRIANFYETTVEALFIQVPPAVPA